MSREQGPGETGMRPPASAAGRRRWPSLNQDSAAEAAR